MPRLASGNGRDWRRGCKKKPVATVEFSPLSQRKAQQRHETVLSLRTTAGIVKVMACYGWDPGQRKWGCPMRERWGLRERQELSPGLEERLAFTITATASYSEAAALAEEWMGEPVDDSMLHALTQRLGQRAEEQLQERVKSVPQELSPQRAGSELAVFMLDGWQARYRGPGFGKKKTKKKLLFAGASSEQRKRPGNAQ
jgi:hypothetical protein